MLAGTVASEGSPAIKGLFAHALQFVPESNEALSFTSIYFSGLPSSSCEQQSTQKSQTIPLHTQLNPLPQTQNGLSISQQKGGNGVGQRQEQIVSSTQPKRVMLSKMSNANQPIFDQEQTKYSHKQSNKLTPILRGSLVPLTSEGRRKIQSRQDPFNQVKDGFFSPQEHGFSLTSSTQFNPANNKNTRSTSNLPGSGGGGGGGRIQPLDSLSNNINGTQSIQNNYYYGNNLNNNNTYNQNSQLLEDEELYSSMEQNPYAMGWANNVLKEQFSVALRQIDEKNGRKKWIIRKVKFDKIANQTHYSSGMHSASAYPLTKQSEGTNNINGNNQLGKNIQVESRHKSNNNHRRLKKNSNQDKSSNTSSEIFTRIVIAKQKKNIVDSTPELIDFTDLRTTMNFNPHLIAGNILSHTTIFKNGRQQQGQKNISIDSLTPSCISIMEKAYQLPIYNRNFKFNIEKTAFLNKILFATL